MGRPRKNPEGTAPAKQAATPTPATVTDPAQAQPVPPASPPESQPPAPEHSHSVPPDPDGSHSHPLVIPQVADLSQASALPPAAPVEPRLDTPPPPPAPVLPLGEFIAQVEGRHLARDVVVVEVTHPAAQDRVYPGTYGGIRVKSGPLGVTFSDGAKE